MSSNYTWYPQIVWDVDEGDIPDISEEAIEMCEEINAAMKGWGADKKPLTAIMGTRSAKDRYMISEKYESLYGETLYDKLKSEFSGDFARVLKLLSLSSVDAEAKMVYDALKGFGAREQHLYPVLCGRSNGDMTLLKKAYFKAYGSDLVSDLKSNLGGDLEALLVMCAQGIEENYDPEKIHTEEQVEKDVETFYKAGAGKWGTDEHKFFKTICISPSDHLKAVDAAYTKKYGNTMKRAAKKELGGYAEEGATYIIDIKLGDATTAIAEEIKKTTKGIGTDEDGLMNWIVRLSIIPDLFRAVMDEHQKLFDKSIEKRVSSEVGGDFEKILLKLIETAKTSTYE